MTTTRTQTTTTTESQSSPKWRVECPDCHAVGEIRTQRYKAENEMWEHRHRGHGNAKVAQLPSS